MDPILGQIILWPLEWVPDGWLPCDGRKLPIQQNAALFSLLNTTYGGNGSTDFALPDLRGRVPIGATAGVPSPAPLGNVLPGVAVGKTGGASVSTVTLPVVQHTHTLSGVKAQSTMNVASEGSGQVTGATPGSHLVSSPASTSFAASVYQAAAPAADKVVALAASTISTTVTGTTDVAGTGNTVAVTVTNPYLAMQYIIAVVGNYPMRP